MEKIAHCLGFALSLVGSFFLSCSFSPLCVLLRNGGLGSWLKVEGGAAIRFSMIQSAHPQSSLD